MRARDSARARPLGLVVVVALVGVAAPARAQLPLPDLGGEGAKVRLAGSDRLLDEVIGFEARVDEALTEAEGEAARLEGEATDDVEAAETRALRALAQQRVEVLTSAASLLDRAQRLIRAEVTPLKRASFSTMVELQLDERRLERTLAEQRRAADRLAALGVGAPTGGARRALAQDRLAAARALRAQARVFETRARLRQRVRSLESARGNLAFTDREQAALRSAVEEAEHRLEAARRAAQSASPPEVAPPPRRLAPETLERYRALAAALEANRQAARDAEMSVREAELDLARTRYAAFVRLRGAARVEDPEALDLGRLASLAARAQGQRASAETERVEVRELRRTTTSTSAVAPLLVGRERALDETLSALEKVRHLYDEASAALAALSAVERARARARPWPLTALYVALVLAVALVLLTRGPRLLRTWFGPRLSGLKLPERRVAQLDVAWSLLWPLGVLAAAGAVVVWPILRLPITLWEALQAIDTPLFYVDDTAVSVLSVLQLVAVLWLAVVLSRWLRRFFGDQVYPKARFDIGLTNALDTLVHYVLLVLGLVIGLRFVGVGFSSLALLAGVLGIGIGFGLRNITENFISGLIILAERPVKIGDYIQVNDGDVEGRVESIRARSTTVLTRDNISMIIPNSEFVAKPVVNWSHGDPKVRIDVPVGVVYGSDTDLVRRVLLEVSGRHGQVLKKPAPEVQFRAFGASSLDFLLLVWIDEQQHRFRIASDLHFAIDKAFRKRNIVIAFPQLSLHLETMHPRVSQGLHAPLPVPEQTTQRPHIPDERSLRPGAARAGRSERADSRPSAPALPPGEGRE